MTTVPVCPQDYNCTFTIVHPRVIVHHVGLWWHGGAGVAVAIIAVIALAAVFSWMVYAIAQLCEERMEYIERQEQRKHEQYIEGQRTLQADAAKGNPEMLKMIRERI